MTRSLHHARFIPSEEIDAKRVRQWHFGSVGQSAAGGALRPLVPELPVLGDLLPPASAQPKPSPEVNAALESAREENAALAAQLQAVQIEQMLEQARQQARQEAYQEGFEAGKAQGMEQGRAEGHAAGSEEGRKKFEFFMSLQGKQLTERLTSVIAHAEASFQAMHSGAASDVLALACDIARQVVRQELKTNPQALLPVVRQALDMLGAELKPSVVRLNPGDWAQIHKHLQQAHPQPKIEWLADESIPAGGCVVESAGALIDASLERRWQRAVAALGLVSTWYEGGV